MLDASIELRIGDLDLGVSLVADSGETVALLGPNGAGKTTLVRALAGLLPIEGGRIVVADRVLDDPTDGTFVETGDRPVGVVFQDHLLFPRMSARDNVAFGLRAHGMDRRAAAAEAGRWLERFDIADVADARPSSLSGGQAQRVALARALATKPRLLLLDEPLAALDASTRVRVRAELRRHLGTFDGVRILVTHDPIDALVLADRLVIVEHGRVTQVGTPAEVTARPATAYVADLVGINLLRGRLADDQTVALSSGGSLIVVGSDAQPGAEVAVAIRPQALALHLERPAGSPRNVWRAPIVDLESDRDRLRVTLGGDIPVTAEVTTASATSLSLAPGQELWVSVKAVDITVYET
ncbi:ABC transporter ATP-binding protein [Actinospongicola halichondriae]|uniref:ABC transporter ATP-binding protein n=1 Tax=Actinospongicola halichondriae TaxID=3236844 RepID=UPI003D5ACA56